MTEEDKQAESAARELSDRGIKEALIYFATYGDGMAPTEDMLKGFAAGWACGYFDCHKEHQLHPVHTSENPRKC